MGIKKIIKSCFLGEYTVSLYHIVMSRVSPRFLSDEKAVKKFYKKWFGQEINLEAPATFAEKTNWYKLNARNPLMVKCADKVSVREYVAQKGYGYTLNTVYGVYDKVEDIDFDSLPNQFVIKAAHGSHMNYIVKDKSTFDWKHAKLMMKSWLRQDIYWSGREWVYKDIPKRIIIEKYLEDENGELRDYKFFCFHGKPERLQVDIGRHSNHYRNFYNIDKTLLRICDTEKLPFIENIPFPISDDVYNRMVKMSKDLAQPFQQVRVDLYAVGSQIYFGELTFFDGGGTTMFFPAEWDYRFSEMWDVNRTFTG